MIRRGAVVWAIGLCVVCSSASGARSGWQPLFSDNDLSDWESIGSGDWTLSEDGVLSVKGSKTEDVILLSNGEFGDFELEFEYNLDSIVFGDILFRAHPINKGYYGYLCEIAPYAGSGAASGFLQNIPGTGHIYTIGGPSLALTNRKKVAKSTLKGEVLMPGINHWHKVRIRAVSGEITVEVNDQPATTCKDDRYISGRIGFGLRAGYTGGIQFRNIEFRDLTDESGYVPLFNGEDLTGWKIHGQPQQWTVEDGMIKSQSIDGAYSYLATEKEYKNFSILAEFQGLANGNSGLFFHSKLDGTNINGIQAEVQPPTEKRLGHSGCLYDSGGRGWLIDPETLRPEQEAAFRMNEWNTLRVDVKDHHITTWLNGVRIVDFMDENPTNETGVIALQIHSGGGVKVNWKNIRIKELD